MNVWKWLFSRQYHYSYYILYISYCIVRVCYYYCHYYYYCYCCCYYYY